MLNLTRLHLGSAHESQFQGLGIISAFLGPSPFGENAALRFDRGRLPDPVSVIADVRAAPRSTIRWIRSRPSLDRSNVFTGRVGALLRGTFGSTGAVWQPYLKGNVWWSSNGFDTVPFEGVGIQTGRNGGTTLEGDGGITGKLARNVSVYGDAGYLTSVLA
jgi:hypothetical protein